MKSEQKYNLPDNEETRHTLREKLGNDFVHYYLVSAFLANAIFFMFLRWTGWGITKLVRTAECYAVGRTKATHSTS